MEAITTILGIIGFATVVYFVISGLYKMLDAVMQIPKHKATIKYWIGQYNKAEDMYEEKVMECNMLENENRKLKSQLTMFEKGQALVEKLEEQEKMVTPVFIDKSKEEINNIFGEPRRSSEHYQTTQEEMDEMFRLVQKLTNIITQKEIAEKINTCPSNISNIANRRTERNASLGKHLPKLRELAKKHNLI